MDPRAERVARFDAREARAHRPLRPHGEDLRAAASLVVDGTKGVMGVVAGMQDALSPPIVAQISAFVNAMVRGTTGVVGASVDVALAALAPLLGASVAGAEREAVLAVLNGVVGDRLADRQSPLAINMTLRPPLDERKRGTLLLFVHGSSMNDLQWRLRRAAADGSVTTHDHARALMNDLERDVTLAYIHYNSGRHVAHNGAELAALIEREHVGFDEIMLVGHSMGGLVARSAIAAAERAGHAWRPRVSVLVTLGTPHHGAPLERMGHLLELVVGATPWTAPLATLGTVRSAGVTDLRHGTVVDVVDDDSERFAHGASLPTHVPLPSGVRCHAIAATRSDANAVSPIGDDLVPVRSALGLSDDGARTLAFTDRKIVYATNHLTLLGSEEVYASLRAWCR